jgi:hypothetical protein
MVAILSLYCNENLVLIILKWLLTLLIYAVCLCYFEFVLCALSCAKCGRFDISLHRNDRYITKLVF